VPGMYRGIRRAAIFLDSLVPIALMVLALNILVLKVPNPERTIFSPLERTLPISSRKTSIASSAAFFVVEKLNYYGHE